MRKRIVAILLIIALTVLSPPFSLATDINAASPTVQPAYHVITNLGAGLSGQVGYVTVRGAVLVGSNTLECHLTVELQQKVDGIWVTIESWFDRAPLTVEIIETYFVPLGEYRVKATARIFNSNGIQIETATQYSR